MSGVLPASPDPARVLLVRGGDLAAIRTLLASIGATVEVLVEGAEPRPQLADLPHRAGRPDPSDQPEPTQQRLHVGPLVVDPAAHEAWVKGRRLRCTATEFALLVCLAERPGQVFSRRQLLERLRQSADFVTERTIDTHVNNLRRKLGDDTALVETVFGVGYKLRAAPRRLEAVSSASSA